MMNVNGLAQKDLIEIKEPIALITEKESITPQEPESTFNIQCRSLEGRATDAVKVALVGAACD